MKFRSRVVEIEAIEWKGTEESYSEILRFAGATNMMAMNSDNIAIHTLEGTMIANVGDWIVKGLEGEFYPVKPSIFAKKYEETA